MHLTTDSTRSLSLVSCSVVLLATIVVLASAGFLAEPQADTNVAIHPDSHAGTRAGSRAEPPAASPVKVPVEPAAPAVTDSAPKAAARLPTAVTSTCCMSPTWIAATNET
ncbi:MAG: hypothetical protein IPG93_12380 [Burkholderiales bacterium]|nr:hypothetical protein [Burkholderiales bacterium]